VSKPGVSKSDRLRDATILGAAALAVTDRAMTAAASEDALSPSTAAALSALRHFLNDATLDQLRSVLGLTHSGTVRLVDRLCDSGLTTRGPGSDGRSRIVRLTERGAEIADEVTEERLSAIDALTTGLSTAEKRTLVELLGRVLANVVATKDGGAWTCRLCSVSACGRERGLCPTANAASERFGPAATGVQSTREVSAGRSHRRA
jgi:DNA-binding MarR family transcriptional regulator